MKYASIGIFVQEIPNEISLGISISGCPIHCMGCHSSFTWDKEYGKDIDPVVLRSLLEDRKHISCVLFYGGDWEYLELLELLKVVRRLNLKTALYSGYDTINTSLLPYVDYYKIGHYDRNLGGLSSVSTNQKLYKVVNNSIEDITHQLRKEVKC